jgi:hypothetical protein
MQETTTENTIENTDIVSEAFNDAEGIKTGVSAPAPHSPAWEQNHLRAQRAHQILADRKKGMGNRQLTRKYRKKQGQPTFSDMFRALNRKIDTSRTDIPPVS